MTVRQSLQVTTRKRHLTSITISCTQRLASFIAGLDESKKRDDTLLKAMECTVSLSEQRLLERKLRDCEALAQTIKGE